MFTSNSAYFVIHNDKYHRYYVIQCTESYGILSENKKWYRSTPIYEDSSTENGGVLNVYGELLL